MEEILKLESSGLSPELVKRLRMPTSQTYSRLTERIRKMYADYVFPETDLICSCMTADTDTVAAVYGFLYSEQNPATRQYTHRWICASPAYLSADGEYRHRIIPYSHFEHILQEYSDIFELVENMVLEGELGFIIHVMYPKSFSGNEQEFEANLESHRISVYAYAVCWLFDFHFSQIALLPNHVNPAYAQIISDKRAKSVYDRIGELLAERKLTYGDFLSSILTHLDVGQKLFPLTKNALTHSGDIIYPVWRELYFDRLTSDLTINLVSPSFPVTNRWFYMQNTDYTVFDNPSQNDKYVQSGVAMEITDMLNSANRLNFSEGRYRNKKFMALSQKIGDATRFSRGNIQLTDICLCMTTEHIGRTMRDLPALATHSEMYQRVLNEPALFRKHIFEMLYGLYALNSKAGLIHGDLHLNNCGIYQNSKLIGQVAYVLDDGGSPRVYAFEHIGLYSTIIDFSRSLIGDTARLSADFGERFSEVYISEQNSRVLYVMEAYFPEIFKKRRAGIESLVRSDFQSMFRMLTLIDPYIFATYLADVLNEYKNADASAIRLLRRISSEAESAFENLLDNALGGKPISEWPILSIIKTVFAEDEVKNEKAVRCDLCDVFSMMNPLKYSTRTAEEMPPGIKILINKYEEKPEAETPAWMFE